MASLYANIILFHSSGAATTARILSGKEVNLLYYMYTNNVCREKNNTNRVPLHERICKHVYKYNNVPIYFIIYKNACIHTTHVRKKRNKTSAVFLKFDVYT